MIAVMTATASVDKAFRREVATFRSPDGRRYFPMQLNVGAPDGVRRQLEVPWPVPPSYDAGLRLDLADALVGALSQEWPRTVAAWGWLTRPGLPEVHDCDLAWMAVVRHAFGVHDLAFAGFRVVTRSGWRDLLTGESRTWKRLRV